MGIKVPIRIQRDKKIKNMKVFAPAVFALVAADDKKVPPRHPLQRLNKLNMFASEWCDDNLSAKQAANWKGKFGRNTARFEDRFVKCGFYDDQLTHGGPAGSERKRRSGEDCEADDVTCIFRYDKNNPVRGIKQITKGFEKWALRYVSTCQPKQPSRQVQRATKWNGQLVGLLAANLN